MARGPWLAVDQDGFIARFDPGAEGTIPKRALARARGAQLVEAVDLARVARHVATHRGEPLRPSTLSADRMLIAFEHEGDAAPGYRDPARIAQVPERFARFASSVLRDREPRIIITETELDAAIIMELAKDPDVLHLLGARDVELFAGDIGWADGLYAYRHDDERHEDHVYARVGRTPSPPLHERDIPSSERVALLALRIPVSFATSPTIDVRGLIADQLGKAGARARDAVVAPVEHTFPGWMRWMVLWLVGGVVVRVLVALTER